MEAKTVDVDRGWGWFVDGWALFMKNPGIWVLMILIYALIMILLSFVPILGFIVSALLGTILAGGLIYGASQLDSGMELEIPQLFQAFQDATKTLPMLILGLISLVASLLMGVVSIGLVGGIFAAGGTANIEIGISMLVGLLLLLLVAAALLALLFYAIPLVMLKGYAPIEGVKFSFLGSVRNWKPLLLFGLIYALLAVIATIPLGLGFLILGPVAVGAWYQSYKELYVD